MNSYTVLSLLRLNRQVLLPFNLSYPIKHYSKKDTGSKTFFIYLITLLYSFNKIHYFLGVSMLGGVLKKKKLGKTGPVSEKRILPVETDPERLVTYCCGSNIYKTGEDVKLKPDSEYPNWLWEIRLGPPPSLEELDPNTKEYWRRLRKLGIERNLKLSSLKKF